MRHTVLLLVLALFSSAVADEGATYLVICHDSYENAVRPLVEWRHATGMRSKLVLLSETGADSASVRRFIAGRFCVFVASGRPACHHCGTRKRMKICPQARCL